MKKMLCSGLLVVVFAAAFPVARVIAQVVYAAVHGTVTDSTGAVVPGASITVTNTSTGIVTKATTDKGGYYIFPQLQVGGPYTVAISAPGFQAFASRGLTLNVNDNRDVDAKLQVGSSSETLEVSATAVQVETSNTQLQQIVTADQLEQIPLEGRDAAGLQKLEPGVVESSDRFGSFSSNGNQTPQNSYLVNGIDINDPALQSEGIQVNPDALQEENIVTSTMNPEFARNSGATVNQILKSGTNQLHGSGFEFYRDTFLNLRNYFSLTKPQFHQNLYGGTLGGPVIKNKLLLFLAYQGQRQRSGATTNQQTFSLADFQGNFSADDNYLNASGAPANTAPTNAVVGLSSNPIPFPITPVGGPTCPAGTAWNVCFPTGKVNIAPSTWNSTAATLIKSYVPQPNFFQTNSLGQQVPYFNFNAGSTVANDQGIIKVDYTPTSKDTIWAASIFQSAPQTSVLTFGGGSFPGFGSTEGDHFKLFSADYTHTFSPILLNDLRLSYYRNPFGAVNPSQVVAPGSVGFSINPQNPQSGLPYISLGNIFNLGFSYEGPQPRLDTNLTYADNLTLVRGNHTLKFGGQFEQFRVRNPFSLYNNGLYSFAGGTGQGGTYSSGDPVIDFVMGIPDSYEQTNNGFIDAVSEEIFGFGQDNWKVNTNLTLNFGVSYDVERPFRNYQDGGKGIVCFSPGAAGSTVFPGAAPGLLFPGDSGCNTAGGVNPRYDHFSPRVGFAYSPDSGPSFLFGQAGSHQFSIRGGFGVYFNRDQEEQSLQNLEDPPNVFISRGAADFGGSPSFKNPFADVAGGGSEPNPFPYTVPPPGSKIDWTDNYSELELATFDKKYNVPYTYNLNLNIQRAVGRSMVAQIAYVGSISHRLASWTEGDPITAAGHATCLASATCTKYISDIHYLFPQYTAYNYLATGNPGGLPNGTPWYLSDADQLSEGASNYNSFQASLLKSMSHGLQFSLAYTFGHSLDNGSGYESAVNGSAGRLYNYVPGFQYLNYGDSDFDTRHRLVSSYIYEIPAAGRFLSNVLLRETLTGWEVAGITAVQTGFPIGIGQGSTQSGWCDAFSYFGCPDNPNTTSFHPASLNPRAPNNAWFSTTVFSSEPVGTFGNTKRNYFHGPGFNYTNLQVAKNFHVTQDTRRYLQLRMEAFNAFNHANFANPNGTFLNSEFGQISSVKVSADPNSDPSPARAVQLSGKFYF